MFALPAFVAATSATWQKGPEVDFRWALNTQPLPASEKKLISQPQPFPTDSVTDIPAAIPAEFDLATKWPQCATAISDVRDSGHCACSWGISVATALTSQLCIATKGLVQVPLSSQDICFNANAFHSQGCGGGNMADAYNYIQHGVVTGGNQNATGPFGGGWCCGYSKPHCQHDVKRSNDPYPLCPSGNETNPPGPTSCDATAKSPYNDFTKKFSYSGKSITGAPYKQLQIETQIQQSIMVRGPATTSFTVFRDFLSYVSGVFQSKEQGEPLGGIAVSIVGWGVDNGTKYWKVKNSFNEYWGEKGYFRIIRGINHCGFESSAVTTPDDVKWSAPGFEVEQLIN